MGAPAWAKGVAGSDGSYYNDAVALFEKGDFRGAVIQLKNELKTAPDNLAARLLLGRVYLRLGAGADAEAEFRLARRNGVDDSVLALPLAQAYFLQRKYKELLADFEPAAARAEDAADLLLVRGDAWLELSQPHKARTAYDEAFRRLPGSAATHLALARLHLALRENEEAQSKVERAIALEPGNADAWHLAGEIHRRLARHERAIETFDKALAIDPDHRQARLSRAVSLVELRRFDEARSDVERVRKAAPNNPWPSYLLSLILTHQGDPGGAKAALGDAAAVISNAKRALALDHEPTLLAAAVIYMAQGQIDNALIYMARYVSRVPENVSARKLHARLLLKKRKLGDAIAALEAVREIAGDDVDFYNLLGTTYAWARQFDKAMVMFDRAASLRPDDPELRTKIAVGNLATGMLDRAVEGLSALNDGEKPYARAGLLLGMVHLRERAYDEALAVADRVLRDAPGNVIAHEIAGLAHLGRGDPARARQSFEKAREIAPDFTSARLHLARLYHREGRTEAATAEIDSVLEGNGSNVNALFLKALLAEQGGHFDKAVDPLRRIVGIDAQQVTAQVKLIELLVQAGRAEEALAAARGFDRDAGTPYAILFARAGAEFALGDFASAAETLRRAADAATGLGGEAERALMSTAFAQYRARDVDGARRTLERAVERNPAFFPAVEPLLNFHLRDRRFDEAAALVARFRRARPRSPLGVRLSGDLLMGEGRFSEAAQMYERAQALANNTVLVMRRFEALRRAGGGPETLGGLRQWLVDHPDDGVVQRALAANLMAFGRNEEAVRHHEALLAGSPDDAGLLNNLAILYDRVGDDRALDYAEKAYKLAPEEPAMLDTYGWLLVLAGEAQEGMRYLRTARLKTGDDPRVLYHYAVALNHLGRTGEAVKELRSLLDGHRTFNGVDEARALLRKLSAN